MKRWLCLGLLTTSLAGCSDGADETDGPIEQPKPAGYQLGDGENATLRPVFQATAPHEATALEFNAARPEELWVLLRQPYEGVPCTEDIKQGCAVLEGRVAIVLGASGETQTDEVKTDPNAWHFMRRPVAIAFGAGQTFATCGEFRTGNFEDSDVDYMGPTLWTSDPAIFAIEQPPPPDGSFEPNGSHLDMLHETPYCMGIAHERDNVYWTFNGKLGAIDRYDFKDPHPAGGDDHSDGEVMRYVEGTLARSENVPSQMVYDAASARLYVADSGNGRVVALDTKSGTPGEQLQVTEPIALRVRVDGATLTEVIPPGVLTQPSGLALAGGTLFVTDRATGLVHAFDGNGLEVNKLDTGLGAGTIAGLTVGPDDRVYLVDQYGGRVLRVDVVEAVDVP